MERTPARIRLFRAAGLCQSQGQFATTLGFAKRTISNAERGAHPPSLALLASDRPEEASAAALGALLSGWVVPSNHGPQRGMGASGGSRRIVGS